jgi:hypothetical protein
MSTKSKLQQSRNKWKEKAVERSDKERYLRKENNRIKKERDQYKKELNKIKKQIKKDSSKNISPVHDKEDLVYIALQLFLVARISFRAVSRVLDVLSGYLGLSKIPSTQTIINWVIRLSIARIQNASQRVGSPMICAPFSDRFICIVDISIGLGVGKILTVLFLDAKHHLLNKGAPTLQQLYCVAVAVADSWTGETIADFLQKVIVALGKPIAYLKEGGKDLAKAVRLLDERGYFSFSIDDISHRIANLLKHEYQDHPLFETFISACGQASKKLKQTLLACLVPPKVSTQARFMNLHRLVKWAEQLLHHLPPGRASAGSLLSKLRASLGQMPQCKAFINRFLRDANSLLACQKILKTKGLSQETYRECQFLIETLPPQSAVRIGFIHWIENQLSVAVSLGLDKAGMPVSSDNIESLWGVAKQQGTGEVKEANRIALRIPAICGELTRKDAQSVLEISVQDQQKVVESLPSLIKQRRQVLPHPGCLEEIQPDGEKQNLELIPGSKKRSKKLITPCISSNYHKITVPLIDLKKPSRQSPEITTIEASA